MELDQIVSRFIEGLVFIDSNYDGINVNRRTHDSYLPGLPPMFEVQVSEEILKWWVENYPTDFNPREAHQNEYPYPDVPRANCDIVMSSDGNPLANPELAIEVKRIQLVGDNGKNNDHGIQKVLSPYLKDRSLIHDIIRMKKSSISRRKVVLGFGFEYDFLSCQEAFHHHPNEETRIKNIRGVCHSNDPINGQLYLTPLITIVNRHLSAEGLISDHCVKRFQNAWRHPCGGNGRVFAWEVS